MPKRTETDLRDAPAYGIREAAHYLGVPVSTIRVWAVGRRYPTQRQGPKTARPLFSIADAQPPTLSFWNLVELYVLACMRRQHGVPLPSVRRALHFVQKELSVQRPLIEQTFLTDGKDLFIERYTQLVNASDAGQLTLLLTQSLQRIEADAQGLASKLYPWRLKPDEPRSVEIDPQRAFGRLIVTGTGIPTAALAERFRGGDSVEALANDYDLSREQIEAAIRWEHRGEAA